MWRTVSRVLAAILFLVTAGWSPLAEAGPWKTLFDGESMSGWKADMHPNNFSVVDGVLKTHGAGGMSHLFYVGDSEGVGDSGNSDSNEYARFTNFELQLECRGEPSSNSGVFFHTDWELRKKKYLNVGYELQLNSTDKEKKKTGSLYAVVNLDTSPVDETKWFDVRLRVKGKRIQVWLNGEQVQDYTEPANPKREASRAKRLISPNGGAIALQAHDPKSIFYFRNIQVRELP